MNFHSQPKVELHLHLDCSLSYEVVQKLNPAISYEEYRESFIAPAKCTDLADYIKRAVKGFELMQTREQLELVTFDLFRQLKDDHVVYAEIRFAPLQHILMGLKASEVVDIVNRATEDAVRTYNVEAGVILCTLRHYSEQQSMETVALVNQFKGTRVVGFDIAADEAGFPITNHVSAFQFAKANDILCTAHAGEAKGAGSVWETIENLHPSRIGHGVRCTEDPALMTFLKQGHIHLEVCPTSNVQTNIYVGIQGHPIDRIFKSGISMSINTDARTISDVTLTDEYQLISETFNWNNKHFQKCNLEAIKHAFTTPEIKEKIRQIIAAAY